MTADALCFWVIVFSFKINMQSLREAVGPLCGSVQQRNLRSCWIISTHYGEWRRASAARGLCQESDTLCYLCPSGFRFF